MTPNDIDAKIRTRTLSVKVTEAEEILVKQRAQLAGVNLREYMRHQIFADPLLVRLLNFCIQIAWHHAAGTLDLPLIQKLADLAVNRVKPNVPDEVKP